MLSAGSRPNPWLQEVPSHSRRHSSRIKLRGAHTFRQPWSPRGPRGLDSAMMALLLCCVLKGYHCRNLLLALNTPKSFSLLVMPLQYRADSLMTQAPQQAPSAPVECVGQHALNSGSAVLGGSSMGRMSESKPVKRRLCLPMRWPSKRQAVRAGCLAEAHIGVSGCTHGTVGGSLADLIARELTVSVNCWQVVQMDSRRVEKLIAAFRFTTS